MKWFSPTFGGLFGSLSLERRLLAFSCVVNIFPPDSASRQRLFGTFTTYLLVSKQTNLYSLVHSTACEGSHNSANKDRVAQPLSVHSLFASADCLPCPFPHRSIIFAQAAFPLSALFLLWSRVIQSEYHSTSSEPDGYLLFVHYSPLVWLL